MDFLSAGAEERIMKTKENMDNPPAGQDARMPMPVHQGASRREKAGLGHITIMMGFLFFVGIGWVMWESHTAGKNRPTEEHGNDAVMVEAGLLDMKTISAKDVDREGGTRKMTEAFYRKTEERQVPLADLKVNPFITFGWEKSQAEASAAVQENVAEEVPVDAAPPVDKLQLQSVLMMGSISSATISGVLVTKGQVVDGWTVADIHPTEVVLKWRDKKHILEMSQ